jgi:phosphatidylinositol-3-phosphatase
VTTDADGQAVGTGCVYPPAIQTVADQLEAKKLTWRAYMEDMGNDLARDGSATCSHPAVGADDHTHAATPADQYATRHDPFVYFHSVIDDAASCNSHVVNLGPLKADLHKAKKTRNYTFITPDLCSDGHDATCADPAQAGGYAGIDAFLQTWVPRILKSKAFKADGALFIVFDESENDGTSCCFTPTGPNTPLQGVTGPGGGKVGMLVLSPFVKPGTTNANPYNHYSMLRSVEDIFGLGHLGFAARSEVTSFGRDVFSKKKPTYLR